MKKILLPTDFSDNSWNAIKYAVQLFKDEECAFHLLNTYMPIIFHMEDLALESSHFDIMDSLKQASVDGLEKVHTKIKEEFNNPKHVFLEISSFNALISEIVQLNEGHMFDLIIMGTKGATGAKEILFGTNTVHVLKNVKCPVLAIPDNFDFETPQEILFPSDYEVDFKDNHVQLLIDIAETYHSRVNILNATYGYELSEIQEKNRLKLEIYFKKIAHLFHSVSNQNVADAINIFQQKSRINMLVMINNKHSFFENLFFKSTIRQIGFHLNIPFLVIPSRSLKK